MVSAPCFSGNCGLCDDCSGGFLKGIPMTPFQESNLRGDNFASFLQDPDKEKNILHHFWNKYNYLKQRDVYDSQGASTFIAKTIKYEPPSCPGNKDHTFYLTPPTSSTCDELACKMRYSLSNQSMKCVFQSIPTYSRTGQSDGYQICSVCCHESPMFSNKI